MLTYPKSNTSEDYISAPKVLRPQILHALEND